MDKKRVKDDQRTIEVLLQEWDPIGVYQGPECDWAPPGEYDSYAPSVLGLLVHGGSEDALCHHLDSIAVLQMGFPSRPEYHREIAKKIVTWWLVRKGEE